MIYHIDLDHDRSIYGYPADIHVDPTWIMDLKRGQTLLLLDSRAEPLPWTSNATAFNGMLDRARGLKIMMDAIRIRS